MNRRGQVTGHAAQKKVRFATLYVLDGAESWLVSHTYRPSPSEERQIMTFPNSKVPLNKGKRVGQKLALNMNS